MIVGLFVYFFNDRLKKKYDILAKMWKIPVATYNQVGKLVELEMFFHFDHFTLNIGLMI